MKLLYEDKEIIVCEKPAGTASQNERGFTADMVSLLTVSYTHLTLPTTPEV